MLFNKKQNKKEFAFNKNHSKQELTRENRSNRETKYKLFDKYRKALIAYNSKGFPVFFNLGDLIQLKGEISYWKNKIDSVVGISREWVVEGIIVYAKVTKEFYEKDFEYTLVRDSFSENITISLGSFKVIDKLDLEYQFALEETKHIEL